MIWDSISTASAPVCCTSACGQALTRSGVPAEMYLFEHGSHGMGMKAGFGTASEWPRRAEEWLRNRGLLEAVKP